MNKSLKQLRQEKLDRQHDLDEFYESLLECDSLLDISNDMWDSVNSDLDKMRIFVKWKTVRDGNNTGEKMR